MATIKAQIERAYTSAMNVETVKSASLRARCTNESDNTVRGIVYDESTGIEFDVGKRSASWQEMIRRGGSWYANDDEGRYFWAWTLGPALEKAIRANQ